MTPDEPIETERRLRKPDARDFFSAAAYAVFDRLGGEIEIDTAAMAGTALEVTAEFAPRPPLIEGGRPRTVLVLRSFVKDAPPPAKPVLIVPPL